MGTSGDPVKDDKAVDQLYKAFKVTEQEREITKAVVRKIAKPGLKTKIRVLYIAKKEVFSKVTRKDIVKGTLKQLAHGDLNKFGGANSPEDDYFWQVWYYGYHQRRLMEGYRTRSTEIGAKPFVLNIEELATIWHFPTINVKAPLIKKTVAKRSEPPTETPFASVEDELLVAPRMNLGDVDDMSHDLVVPDIFAAPIAQTPELPTIPQSFDPSRKSDDSVFDSPKVVSPTQGMVTRQETEEDQNLAEEEKKKILPIENIEPLVSQEIPETQRPTNTPPPIPDAIRVLIEQGVEPEDVGIHDTIDE